MFDYGKIIRRSVEIVKKNKWLLIYGALAAGGAGSGGGGGSSSGGGGSNNTLNNIKRPDLKLEDLPKQTSMVLGDYTSTLKDWFSSVSPLTWMLLVFGLFLAVAIGIAAGMIIRSWARASLIAGVQMALADQEVNLANTSPKGKAKTKNLVIFSLITAGIVFGTITVTGMIGLISYILLKDQTTLLTIWSLLVVVPAVIFFVVGTIFLAMISIYAERLIVLENYLPWEAWKKGLSFSRGNFMPTAVMGLINSITAGTFGCLTTIATLIILGIPTFVILLPSISAKKFPSPIVLIFLAIFFLSFIAVMSLISAATEVFKFSNWNQVFAEVTNKEKQPKTAVTVNSVTKI